MDYYFIIDVQIQVTLSGGEFFSSRGEKRRDAEMKWVAFVVDMVYTIIIDS